MLLLPSFFIDLPYDSDFNENLTCSDYVFVCGDEEERDLTCQEMEVSLSEREIVIKYFN